MTSLYEGITQEDNSPNDEQLEIQVGDLSNFPENTSNSDYKDLASYNSSCLKTSETNQGDTKNVAPQKEEFTCNSADEQEEASEIEKKKTFESERKEALDTHSNKGSENELEEALEEGECLIVEEREQEDEVSEKSVGMQKNLSSSEVLEGFGKVSEIVTTVVETELVEFQDNVGGVEDTRRSPKEPSELLNQTKTGGGISDEEMDTLIRSEHHEGTTGLNIGLDRKSDSLPYGTLSSTDSKSMDTSGKSQLVSTKKEEVEPRRAATEVPNKDLESYSDGSKTIKACDILSPESGPLNSASDGIHTLINPELEKSSKSENKLDVSTINLSEKPVTFSTDYRNDSTREEKVSGTSVSHRNAIKKNGFRSSAERESEKVKENPCFMHPGERFATNSAALENPTDSGVNITVPFFVSSFPVVSYENLQEGYVSDLALTGPPHVANESGHDMPEVPKLSEDATKNATPEESKKKYPRNTSNVEPATVHGSFELSFLQNALPLATVTEEFQGPSIYAERSVEENVTLPLKEDLSRQKREALLISKENISLKSELPLIEQNTLEKTGPESNRAYLSELIGKASPADMISGSKERNGNSESAKEELQTFIAKTAEKEADRLVTSSLETSGSVPGSSKAISTPDGCDDKTVNRYNQDSSIFKKFTNYWTPAKAGSPPPYLKEQNVSLESYSEVPKTDFNITQLKSELQSKSERNSLKVWLAGFFSKDPEGESKLQKPKLEADPPSKVREKQDDALLHTRHNREATRDSLFTIEKPARTGGFRKWFCAC